MRGFRVDDHLGPPSAKRGRWIHLRYGHQRLLYLHHLPGPRPASGCGLRRRLRGWFDLHHAEHHWTADIDDPLVPRGD